MISILHSLSHSLSIVSLFFFSPHSLEVFFDERIASASWQDAAQDALQIGRLQVAVLIFEVHRRSAEEDAVERLFSDDFPIS